MKVSIIGIGMGNLQTITWQAIKKIKDADVIIGSKRLIGEISDEKIKIEAILSNEIIDIIKQNQDKNIAVLMSGDTGFYSGCKKIVEEIIDFDVEVVPGISSLSYFASKIKKDWQNIEISSAHGVKCNILGKILKNKSNFFLLDDKNTPESIIKLLNEHNLGKSLVYVGEKLSYADENITCDYADNLTLHKFDKLSVIWIERPEIYRDFKVKIDDCEFIREKVPMTKSEIRTLVCDFFNVKDNDVFFDVGSGTGSIAINFAVRNPMSIVKAVEINENAIKLINNNREKFNAYNVEIFEGEASEKIKFMGVPNHIFIGGSKGNLREIIENILKINNEANILVSAITLETLSECIAIFKEKFENKFEISQINVSKSRKLQNFNMMEAENPIFLIGRKNEQNYDISH